MYSVQDTKVAQNIRIYCTRLLRKYATSDSQTTGDAYQPASCEWAIRLLVTQLYDPEVEVCEVAVQILEEVCNKRSRLEYVVRCRPALDHLNEIGAPLLLRYRWPKFNLIDADVRTRFLSISLGYQYLDRLDYILQEMDDWFLASHITFKTCAESS